MLDLSGNDPDLTVIGDAQLRSAVALQSILLRHGTAYLADEVGMGKTYVALALVALLRCYKPDLRVLYVTPSRNVREKWARRECPAMNVLLDRMHARHRWAFTPREADSIADWVKNHDPSKRDTFISFSAFSFHLDDDPAKWGKSLDGLLDEDEWMGVTDKATIKHRVAAKVFEQVKRHRYDLLVFDEAHLLRSKASDRSDFIRLALRGPEEHDSPVFRAALLLSATPFDRDLDQLRAQLEVVEPGAGQLLRRLHGLKPGDVGDGTRDWSVVQRALKTFMVRRSHELVCADAVARSRNQYRVEHRAAAAIRLRQADPHKATASRAERQLQRLYTAVVQKKLVESKEAASFPLAMFSSWESYTLRRPQQASGEQGGDVLDVKGDAMKGSAEVAKDSNILTELSESWCERFAPEEPPHPKLELEAKRVAGEAFHAGDKQLVFVRRIRSINDLKARIDRSYDQWLAALLAGETDVVKGKWLSYRPKRDTRLPQVDVSALGSAADQSDPPLPASFENLFCWFFRGATDGNGERLAREARRPTPEALRNALTNQTDWRSVLGEVDWRALLCEWLGDVGANEHAELARIASQFSRVSRRTALDNFRYVQLAWLIMRERAWPQGSIEAKACNSLIEWIKTTQSGETEYVLEDIDADTACAALNAPTMMVGLSKRGLLDSLWPLCNQLVAELRNGTADEALLAEFDLYREVLFALVRLDHPFIDLWLSCTSARVADSRAAAEELVGAFCGRLKDQHEHSTRLFSSYGVISQLARGWKYLLKTNFADLKSRRDASGKYHHGIDRHKWRSAIARRVTPRDPVEWASGQNANSRPDIAWRFRMPGYPMVLVSTSVFQEGEDLHTFCRHVTHFGISGSPIGVEQKNGRVDRVGSQSQRLLCAAHTGPAETMIEDRGISIRFPHLTESLEWLQIRDLAMRLNEYQRSLHQMGETRALPAPSMQEALRDSSEIPEQLTDKLSSPFEPVLAEWQISS
ncbi:DEAD/DEAH box helicase family protein [Trinickia soli]|uniref:DEAD/DEAH box helicase family protein n=1 Tax=Trinickia soli TaxID=380675 RepID=UPI003FA36D1B